MRSREDTAPARLLKNSVVDPATGCRNWTRYRNEWGYGVTAILRKSWLAHRLSYRVFVGDPEGWHVLHKCDNPACIEPSHLYLGTDQDNARDRKERGRFVSANSLKTHCKRGHNEWYVNAVGARQCRICVRARNRAYGKRNAR